MLCGGLGAEDALSPFHRVEIHLKDAALVPKRFDHDGDDGLLRLAPGRLGSREKKILCQLLADGGTTGDDFALLLVFFQRFLHAHPVETIVLDKLVVFRRDGSLFQTQGDSPVGHPDMLQLRGRILVLQFIQALRHEAGHVGIEILPPDDPAQIPALPENDKQEQQRQQLLDAMNDCSHAWRSDCRTRAVSGRTPRQT